MADPRREAEEDLEEVLLFRARHGWGNWRMLIVQVSALPDDLVRSFWKDLYETRDHGHAPELFAAIKRYGVPPEPSALKEMKSKLRSPNLSQEERKAADYLLKHDRPSHSVLGRIAEVPKHLAKDRAKTWPNRGMQAYILERRLRPPIEKRLEFIGVAAHLAKHPSATLDAVQTATGVPVSLIQKWQCMPQFEAIVQELREAGR